MKQIFIPRSHYWASSLKICKQLAAEDLLYDIAESGTKTSYKAQAILYAARGTDFPVVLPALASGGDNWYSSFKNLQDKVSHIYPNPTQNSVSFKHYLNKDEIGTLQIFSLMGKEMGKYSFTGEGLHHIDLNNYQTGLYICTFSINGRVVRNNKLSVIK